MRDLKNTALLITPTSALKGVYSLLLMADDQNYAGRERGGGEAHWHVNWVSVHLNYSFTADCRIAAGMIC